jgi:hypothetical protein
MGNVKVVVTIAVALGIGMMPQSGAVVIHV